MTSTQHTLPVAVPVGRSAGRKLATLLAALAVLAGLAIPVSAEPQGYIEAPFGVGLFYQTFNEGPNVVLIAGGTAAEVCATAAEDEVDPFNAEPGMADSRIFLRDDGSVDIWVNEKGQPIHLYWSDLPAPVWIGQVCAEEIAAEPFASGTADLKVRISVSEGEVEGETVEIVDVFNSVNGKATGAEGTDYEGKEYKVRASADLIVVDGEPQGDPPDFVSLVLTEIKR